MVAHIRCVSLFEDTEDPCVKFCILITAIPSKDFTFLFLTQAFIGKQNKGHNK